MIHRIFDCCLVNLLENPTYIKKECGTKTDLILTTNGFSFQHTQSFETRVSDHHHLIPSMLETI